jgi:hypothetical protein
MLKTYQVAFILSLLVPLAHVDAADARPSGSSSFKSGFSSQRSSSSSSSFSSSKSTSSRSTTSGSFGSFSRRSSSTDGPAPAPYQSSQPARSSGGFGSFGNGGAAPRQSDSALSQKLNRNASEANALRTLDARRQAQADAARDTRPVPGYEHGASGQRAPTYAPPPAYPQPQPQPQPPVVVRQDSGLGHVIAGAVLANAARGAHASGNNGYPDAYPSTQPSTPPTTPGGGAAPAPVPSAGSAFLGLFLTLCMLALVGWAVYFAWRRMRRARAAKKPNYSFERN